MMSQRSWPGHRRLLRWRVFAPCAILALGLLLTGVVAGALRHAEATKAHQRFQHSVEIKVKSVADRMATYVALLQGMAGLFAATDGQVSLAQFRDFTDRLDLATHYPGLFGLGFSLRLPATEVPALEARMRAAGLPGFAVYPAAPRGPGQAVDTIVYLEPLNPPNLAAIGYDMYSDPVRREAMQRAAATGSAAMSGRVQLVQEIGPVKQAGFLIYLPVYRGGTVPATLAERRERLQGFVYSPFRAGDLFSNILSDPDPDGVGAWIYDGDPAPDALLHAPDMTQHAGYRPRFHEVVPLEVAGRRWTLRFATEPGFDAGAGESEVWLFGGGGALATVLLAWVAAREGKARHAEARAQVRLRRLNRGLERRVAQRTRELERVNRQLLQESEERQQVEQQLRQSQKMEAVGQLTGGIAHDFNNLLTVIAGNVELLDRALPHNAVIRRRVEAVKDAAERGARLTSQLLAFSRRQHLEPEPVDLNAVIAGMEGLLRSSIGGAVAIGLQPGAGLWPAMVDPTQIEMAILNLAINARDAMEVGGTLTIATANAVRAPSLVPEGPEAPPPGEYVTVTVRDTGTGMAPEVLARVLEPFFTTKEIGRGSGLGLSQVYGLAKQSGGGLTIDTAPGQGTAVTVFLPRAAAQVAAPASETQDQPGPGGRGHVLVVDDDETVRAVTCAMLEESGFTVAAAADGRAALDLLDRGEKADVIAVDFAMPGMNGLELAAQVQERDAALPILFITGYADTAALSGYVPDGRILQKPFRSRELLTKLEEALGRRAPCAATALPLRWQ